MLMLDDYCIDVDNVLHCVCNYVCEHHGSKEEAEAEDFIWQCNNIQYIYKSIYTIQNYIARKSHG